jgi:rhodanese-related sulfurtransferase
LQQLFYDGHAPVLLDVRSTFSQQGGRIPGAKTVALDDLNAFVLEAPLDGEVIVYCACPNEASAARLAKQLMQRGFTRVRPLLGGIDAWIDAGFDIENDVLPENLRTA